MYLSPTTCQSLRERKAEKVFHNTFGKSFGSSKRQEPETRHVEYLPPPDQKVRGLKSLQPIVCPVKSLVER